MFNWVRHTLIALLNCQNIGHVTKHGSEISIQKHETLCNDNPSMLIAAQIYTSYLDVKLRISRYNLLILMTLSTKFVVQGRVIFIC
jgi:hypothetical protein